MPTSWKRNATKRKYNVGGITFRNQILIFRKITPIITQNNISMQEKEIYLKPTTDTVMISVEQIIMGSYDGNAIGPNDLGDPTTLTNEQMISIFG